MLVGNSFFYYNNSLHNHLGDLYDADPDLDTPRRRSITINGSSLSWHDVESYLSNEEIGSFKIDSDTNTYEPYEKLDIDVVVMMDCSLCPINDERKDSFYKYVKKHSETIRSKGIEPILFMSWPYKNKPEMQEMLEKEFFKASKINNLRLIPAGQAFLYINKNFPNIKLKGVDKEKKFINVAKKFKGLESVEVEINDSYKVKKKYDIVLCSSTVQIFEDFKKPLKKLLSLSKKRGLVFIDGLFNS